MATSSEIKARAKALAEKTDVNSITPKEVGGIMSDLASHSENVLRNGGTLGIRKVYESVSAMEADSTNPVDFWGNPIKKGNLVVIYDGTTTGVDNNKVYAFMNPGWELSTELDAGYATRREITELKDETDTKLSELGSEVFSSRKMEGYVYNYGNGNKVENTQLQGQCTDMISILPNRLYYLRNKGLTGVYLLYWDNNKSFISSRSYNENSDAYKSPSNAAYMAVFTSNEVQWESMFFEDITELNYINLTFNTDAATTRNSIPFMLRKQGLVVSYLKDSEKIVEMYYSTYTYLNDNAWGLLESAWERVILNKELNSFVKETRDNINIIKDAALINDAKVIEPEWNDGGYVDTKGNISSNTAFYYSNPIKLIEGDILKAYCRGTANTAILSITDELGESHAMVSKGTNESVKEYFTYEAVSECYVCISCVKSDTNEFKIFNNQINNKVSKNKNAINDLEKGALVLVKSRNIYNKETSVEGILREAGNIQTSFTDYITSDYIAVKPNTNYVISGNNDIYCYGEFNGSTIIKYVTSQSNLINIVTSPATNYIRISYKKSYTGVQVEEGTEKTTYEAYDKPTIIQSDIEGRKVETSSEGQFEVEYSENLIIFETFTKNGYITWDNSYNESTTFKTSNQVVPIEGGETYSHNLNFVSLRYYDDKMNYLGVQYNPTSPFVVTLGAKYAEISLSNVKIINRSGIIVKGETIPEGIGVGHFPYIKKILKTGMNVYAKLADKTYVNINKWKGCKYASLGDSVTYRDHWQQIVDFHLGTTHKNLACSGMSVGGYAFHYTTGGSEDGSQIGNAVADRLLNADDFADCQFIIICGYANNWAGDGSELGTMNDEFIKISEDSIASFPSVNDYRRSITGQTFIAACRSTVDYIQKVAQHARIIICGQLLMDSSYNDSWDADNIDLHRKNGKGLDSTAYSDAMKEVAEYYSLPYVDLAKKGGVNDMNWNLYYSASDQVHPNFKDYVGGEDFPDSGMYKMARGIISVLESI